MQRCQQPSAAGLMTRTSTLKNAPTISSTMLIVCIIMWEVT